MTIYTQTKTNIDCNKLFINSFLKQINHPFFHYTSVDNAKSIKSSQELWMTNYKRLTDKKEFFHGLDFIISYLHENCARSKNFRDYDENFLQFMRNERKDLQLEMYVMCFCRRKTNFYLAKNDSRGKILYLVEFKFHPDDLGHLPVCLDVIYSQRQFNKNVEKLFNRYADYFYFHQMTMILTLVHSSLLW